MALHPNPGQVSGINKALDAYEAREPGYAIVGEGGTGKTFSVMELVKILIDGGLCALMTAPTNKAVKQLQKAAKAYGLDMSRIGFRTIHSALGLSLMPTSERKHVGSVRESVLPDYDFLVIDEASMLSEVMIDNYLMPEVTKLEMFVLLMGDHMQLPPVKESTSKAFGLFPTSVLTQPERQLNNPDGTPNGILEVAHALRSCIENNRPYEFIMPAHNVRTMRDREFIQYILSQFTIDTDLDDIRVLAWTNRAVNSINRSIRENIYGKGAQKFEIGERIVTGEPVTSDGEIVLSTDEECIVSAVKESTIFDEEAGESWRTLLVTLRPLFADSVQEFAHTLHPEEVDRYERHLNYLTGRVDKAAKTGGNPKYHWRKYHEFKGLFADLKYCYCLTIHRVQGSTYPRIIMDVKDVLGNPVRSERQRLLYVGFSRPQVELVTNKVAFKA